MATFIFHCVFVLALGNVINCLRMRSVEYQTLSAKIKLINEAVGKYSSLDRDVASMKHELIDMKAELLDEKALTSSLLKLLNVSESEAHLPTKDILQRVENLHQKPDHTTSYSDEINSLGIEMKKLKETNTENLSKTYRFIREQHSLIREIQMDIQDTNNNLTKLESLTHQMETNLQELQSLSNKQQPDSYRKYINKSTNVFRNAFLEEKAERKELEKRMLGSINRANDNISELENATTETKHQLIILEKVIENQDCNRLFNNDVIYTAPEYQNNRNCIVIVSNKQLPGHVVQVQFNKFELEESADCRFDYLKLQSGEKEGSPVIGRSYCGKSLEGRTIVTNGSSLRLEFKTDASVALYGFQANISFVRKGCPLPKVSNGDLVGLTNVEHVGPSNSDLAWINEDVKHNTEIEVRCNNGYNMYIDDNISRSRRVNITCNTGNWTENIPVCQPRKCSVPGIKNGEVTGIETGELVEDKTIIQINCKDRYEMIHAEKIADDTLVNTCSLGNWTRSMPICTPKICKLLIRQGSTYWTEDENKVKTMITVKIHLPHTSRVFISCDDGYELVNNQGDLYRGHDPPAVRCGYGSWRNVYHCFPKTCHAPETNGTIEDMKSSYNQDDTVTIKCQSGYKVLDGPMLKCKDKHWSHSGACVPERCPAPETNGTIEDMKSSYYQDETVTIKCQSGYKVLDGPILKCGYKHWSHSGTCVPEICSAPETNGDISHWDKKELYYHGNTVTITCSSGFKIIGGSKLTCEDEQWSHSGTCEYVFGTQCSTINDCANLTDAVCQDGVCACQSGLNHVNGKCEKVLGSECFSDTDCPMTDVHCEKPHRTHAGRCNCKPGTKCGNTIYRIAIKTSKSTWESGWGEGTKADVHLNMIGHHGETDFTLLRPADGYFNTSSIEFFNFDTLDVGRVNYVKISLRKTGGFPLGDDWKHLWISIYSESRREYCIIQNTNWLKIGQTLTLPRDGRIAYFGEGRNVVYTGIVHSTVRESNEYYCMVHCAKSYVCKGVLFNKQRLICSVINNIEQSKIGHVHHSSEWFFQRL